MDKHKSIVYSKSFKGQVVGCKCKETIIYIRHGNCTLALSEFEFTESAAMITEASEKIHPIQGLFNNAQK